MTITVKELINELLECNMDSDVEIKLNFQDVDIQLTENIEVVPAKFNFEDSVLEIKFDLDLEEFKEENK